MKRLIFSTIGITLTFIWIVYTAPPNQDKPNTAGDGHIKTIRKSGSSPLRKIKQPIYNNFELDKVKTENLLVNSGSKNLVVLQH